MVEAFTKRNHYNPCFWTALWNPDYFEALLDGRETGPPARDQEVFVLSLRGDRIHRTKVANVHYDKNLGVAEITPEAMKSFCRRWFPGEFDNLARYVDEHPESLWMDFEDILTAIEERGGYDALIEAARISGVSSPEHKAFVTCVLMIHAMRSHEMMAAMTEFSESVGLAKWEYFWLLKNAWGNPLVLARAVTPLSAARWLLYRTSDHQFPLCDSPVMINPNTLMAVLSPRLLLEINLNNAAPEHSWTVRDGISSSKYREFRRRAIANTFKEIVFHDVEELRRWQAQPEFMARVAALSDAATARDAVVQAAGRVMWALHGFGRVPAEFEQWVRPRFETATDQSSRQTAEESDA